jgi:hypothetical protein
MADGFRLRLERAGLRPGPGRAGMERLGFFVCDADLEDELVRALGVPTVERVIAAEGELGSWRTFRDQPAQRGRATAAQLRRFLGTRSGRKARDAPLLVVGAHPDRVPLPLAGVLAHSEGTGTG